MFQNCTSLKEAPSLPATSLSNYCYAEMFNGCTNLEKAPVLLAKTIQLYSYQNMFKNCSKLNYIRCEATDVSKTGCTTNWVSGVAATGTFVKEVTMENWTVDSANGIPTGWTVQNNLTKLDNYQLTANQYIDLGIINPNNYSQLDSSSSYVYGGVQVQFDITTTGEQAAGKILFTNNNREFYINGADIYVNNVKLTGADRYYNTNPSPYTVPMFLVKECHKSSGNYNNAMWWWFYNWDGSYKTAFLTHGNQSWNFVNSPMVIGSKTGNSIVAKINWINMTIPTSSELLDIKLYPYLNNLTGQIIFMSDDGTYQYEVKSI